MHRLAWTAPSAWTSSELAEQLGVQPGKIALTLQRVVQFGFVRIDPHHTAATGPVIIVPSRLGPLTDRQLRSLPDRLVGLHDRLVDTTTINGP